MGGNKGIYLEENPYCPKPQSGRGRMIIDPRGMSIQQWFDAVILDTGSDWAFGKLLDDDWQEFATGFVRAPPFVQRTLPDPYRFDDWREWAMRTVTMMEYR
jgi:hypothetical protein